MNGSPEEPEVSAAPAAPHPADRPNSEQAPRKFQTTFFLRVGLQMAAVIVSGVGVVILLAVAQHFGYLEETGVTAGTPGAEYTCPMHPQIRQTTPGRCPICGMKLVEVQVAPDNRDQTDTQIALASRRLAQIETAPVTRKTAYRTLQTVGSLAIDESRKSVIAAYVDGRIERVFADYTGVHVRKGDHLAELYSPNLYAAQVGFLTSRAALEKLNPNTLPIVKETQEKLAANSRNQLIELGMTEQQLTELEESNQARSRLTLYTEIDGTVIKKLKNAGQYVKAGEPIYEVANLSTIWLMLELYPEDAALVGFGQRVEAEIQSQPGVLHLGRVAFVDPVVNQMSRTVGVRVELSNETGKLRPGDYASARITMPIGSEGEVYDDLLAGKWISPMHPQIVSDTPGDCPICGMELVPTSKYGFSEEPVPLPKVLMVPREAVLMAGKNSVIYVETEPGRFEIRPVTLGPMTRTEVVILDNLKEGDTVATAGNFLIDSQMQLEGKPSLIDAHRAKEILENKGPLQSDEIHIVPLAGAAGDQLEQFFSAYFIIQKQLADDKKLTESQVQSLVSAGEELLKTSDLPEPQRDSIDAILKAAEHLHHMDLAAAREQFKTVSHRTLLIAFSLRKEGAESGFVHFYCPMVKGGGGDWLQASGPLRNPYFGSEMLSCGELVHELPPVGHLKQSKAE
ncbi:MAG TPA: efflux RND transporter periplasmic adaptor subunit [Planctomycetaceae bacterium]|nr:efflux RND transporter periplasmic adaptor subunit [Planctomycetaceae bacterium]